MYPATGYLVMVWETLGMMMGELYTEVSVVFENVRFQRATNIPKDGNLEFIVMIQKGSGHFEVSFLYFLASQCGRIPNYGGIRC